MPQSIHLAKIQIPMKVQKRKASQKPEYHVITCLKLDRYSERTEAPGSRESPVVISTSKTSGRASHQLIRILYRAADGYTQTMRTHGYYRRFVGLCAPRKFARAHREKRWSSQGTGSREQYSD